MTGPLLPEQLEELMAGYVLGNLSSEEAEELKQLLTEHPELATQVHHLQEVLEVMPYGLPEVAVPQHLRQTILETAAADPIASENPNLVSRARQKSSPLLWSYLISSVAAILALAFGLDNYRLRQQVTTTQALIAKQKDVIAMLQQPNTHLVSLKGMEPASTASGSIIMTPGEPKAVLIVQNLPVLPKGQFYQLWSVVNEEKISWGQFNTSKQGTVFVKLSMPSNPKVTALVVTVEGAPVSKSPEGLMVMKSNFSPTQGEE
jgi:anti-sigma-K factor RskA